MYNKLNRRKNTKGLTLIEVLFVCVSIVFIFLLISTIFDKTIKNVKYEQSSLDLKQETDLALFLASGELQETVKLYPETEAALQQPNGTNNIIFVKYDPNGAGKGVPGFITIQYSPWKSPEGDYNFARIHRMDLDQNYLANQGRTCFCKNLPTPNDMNFKYITIGDKKMIKITLTAAHTSKPGGAKQDISSSKSSVPYTISTTVALRRIYPTITQKNPPFDKDILKGGF